MSSPFISKVSKLNLSPDSRKGTPPKLRREQSGATEKTEEDSSLPTTPTPKGKASAARHQSEQRDSPVPAPKDAPSQASASASGSRAQSRVGRSESEAEQPQEEPQEEGQEEQQEEEENGQEQPTPSLNGGPTESHPEHLDLSVLKGLEVGEDGLIHDQDGNAIGRLVEGKPEDLVGYTVGDNGEILDEDGDLIGVVDVLAEAFQNQQDGVDASQAGGPDEDQEEEEEEEEGQHEQTNGIVDQAADTVGQAADTATAAVSNVADLAGKAVSESGDIKDDAGQTVGKLVEGEPEELAGKVPNDQGEILGDEGDVLGRVDVASQAKEAAGSAAGSSKAASRESGKDAEQRGSVAGTAASKATGSAAGSAADKSKAASGAQPEDDQSTVGPKSTADNVSAEELTPEDAVGEKPEASEADEAKGTVAEKSEAPGTEADEANETVAEKSELPGSQAPATEAAGTEADEAKETVGDKSEAPGSEVAGAEAEGEAKEAPEEAAEAATEGVPESAPGDAAEEKYETAQEEVPEEATEEAPEEAPEEAAEEGTEAEKELPPISSLEGLRCNKLGKIINPATGKPVGELIEGDAKKLASLGAQLDDKGQFWDNRGNVIGRAQTLAPEEYPDEPPFGGLEGLHVVEDGWVEDQNGKRVGKIVDGDAKKVLGRPVDEDGDVTDKHGNVIAKAEYYEAPDEEPEPEVEPEKIDLSSLEGLTPNKLGYVIGPKGVPIGRVVEGNPKELAGKEIHDGQIYDGPKPIGRVELIPENEREKKPEGPFAGLEGLVVNKEGFVEDEEGNIVGKVTEGDVKNLRGRTVDEDGDIIDKFGSVKGHAEPYEVPEEEKPEEVDLSILEGKVVNKAGNVVDGQGRVFGRVVSGGKGLAGRKVDKKGQIWGDDGKVIGQAELVPGADEQKPEGPFFGFDNAVVGKDGVVTDGTDRIIGRVIEGDAKRLQGRKVDEDGDILDKNGNPIGKAERWEPEEKKRNVNPMAGRKVNKEGEVRDADGNLIGKLTSGDLPSLIGKEIDDNGYVVDNDGNKIGECTLIENIPEPEPEPEEPEEEVQEEEPGPSPEELEAKKKEEEDRQLAKKMSAIVGSTLDRLRPICKMISEHVDRADRTPKDELDEEQLVKDVKPLLEEGGQILQECNGSIRALDPDGRIASTAKARAASHEASPEEYALADQLKELTDTVLRTIDNGKKRIAGMPHAKKELNPLWGLLSEPLFQIIAAVGLLLSGVLGLVGRLLEGLGLGPLVKGLLGGLGLDKLLSNLGLTSLTDALGLTGRKKK
ncbi:hypothetical protein BO82DRAFT_352519 [Aspergillus uvarum CBS 121591]|uniref:DUF6987 domain-containing protein n=1 Tax=Aspergillus uvarum CBS 121591 TaxID=1448315 RepID=A0A319CIZ4_9EURO|nr:hypothetical protein BO82DRAFT_352519 [Aspergillus uvarum CBS 121591]PYH83771.1 hypothetical protein BO82DRAFT_352519 [Aspergillus uvarum CBS 121591]